MTGLILFGEARIEGLGLVWKTSSTGSGLGMSR